MRALFLIAGLVGAAHLLDPFAWRVLSADTGGQDWHRLLRICGFLPTWLALAAALWLEDRHGRRAGFLAIAVTASGLIANLLKILFQRGRPGAAGEYVFHGFQGTWWDTAGLGLPSGHTAVAFGAAWALLRLFPRGGWIAVGLATGCGVSRVLERAHFFSDTVLAAGVAWLVTERIWSRWQI